MSAALSEKSEIERYKKFLLLLEQLPAGDAPALFDLLERFKKAGVSLDLESRAFWKKWGSTAPLEALSALTERYPGRKGDAYVSKIFSGWAAKDPEACRIWLNSNPQNSGYNAAFLGFVDGLASQDIANATRTVLNSLEKDDPLLPAAVGTLADAAKANGLVPGLKAWFGDFPEDAQNAKVKQIASDKVYRALANIDIGQAKDWVAQQATATWRNNGMIGNFASRYAGEDPAAAMDWVLTLPSDPKSNINIGVGEVVQQWVNKDARSFESWLSKQDGTSQTFSQAAHDYAVILAKREATRGKAAEWASRIQNDGLRNSALKAVQQSSKKTAK